MISTLPLSTAGPSGALRHRGPAEGWGMAIKHGLLAVLVWAAAVPAPVPAVPHAPLPVTAAGGYSPPWAWPLDPVPVLLRGFDPPAQRWLAGHRGVDLAAAEGTEVLAPADGRVVFARRVVDRPVLTVDHGGGLLTSFEPVDPSVAVGAEVRKGTVVGTVRSGAHCSGRCLHWGVRWGGRYVNPLNYVTDRRPSVLLPVPPERTAAGRDAGAHRGRRAADRPVGPAG